MALIVNLVVVNLALAFFFLCFISTKPVLGIEPHFTAQPNNLTVAYQEGTVNFTWKLSNHSINRVDFGTWREKIGTFGNTIIAIVRNGNKFTIYTSEAEEVKEYRGRMRSTGDLSAGMVSFELINIRQTDQKYYGIEIEFVDDMLDDVSGFTQLVVKPRSFFTSAPSVITKAAHASAYITWRYSLTEEDKDHISALVFGVYKKDDTYGTLCTIKIIKQVVSSSNCSTGMRKAAVRFISKSPTSLATFLLDNLSPDDEGVYALKLDGTRELMENKTRLLVKGVKPHFTSHPNKLIVEYQEETVNFTWKLSNHSINHVYFGTWQEKIGTLGNPIMSIVRNGSKFSYFTSEKKEVKEYRGRVRWTGDLSAGVVSFELINIKPTDQKYYGIEIEFVDDMVDDVSGFTQLVVKPRSYFTSAPSVITKAAHASAYFTWRYSLTEEDKDHISALVFGFYKKDTYGALCTIKIKDKVVSSSKCSTGMRKAAVRFTSNSPTSLSTFVLDNLSPDDEGVYSLKLEGTRELMENKTRLLVKGVQPHFTLHPNNPVVEYQEGTVTFTWKLSNHSINRVDFGTWQEKYGTLGNTIMAIVRSGSKFSIYKSQTEEVKEYRGRVRWTGDLSAGVVSFVLTNIKQTDRNYYGIEIEFNDAEATEVSSFTKLVVKTKPVVEKETASPSVDTSPRTVIHVTSMSSTPSTYSPRCGANIDKGPAAKAFLFIVVASIINSL